jgi:hypothetical protein
VSGTVCAVAAGVDGRISVLRGEVKVRDDEGAVVPVAAGEAWSPRGRVTLERRQARRLLADARPLAARPSKPDARRDGTLILTGGPATAGVRLEGERTPRDDRWLGTLPLATRLPAGEHTLVVQARGHRPRVLRVHVEAGKTSRRRVYLQRAPRGQLLEDEPLVDAAGDPTEQDLRAPRQKNVEKKRKRPRALGIRSTRGDLAQIARQVHESKESLARVRARRRNKD